MKNISIIITLHNRERKLKKIFDSLNGAVTPRGIKLTEVIFIDDGSRDQTFSMFTKLLPEIRYTTSIISYKKPIGEKKAAQIGLKYTENKHVLIIKSDLSDLAKKLNKLASPTTKIKKSNKKKSKKQPLVSVVMPVYNADKFLQQALDSIMAQTYKNFELIVVNDNSTDTSLKIIKSYKRRFRNKIRIIETGKNLNCGGDMCANLGIETARGKYIARMDADDISLPQRLATQVEFLEKNKRVFMVGSSAYVIDAKGKIMGEKNEPCNLSEIYKAYSTFHPIIHPTVMLRRIFHGKKFSYQIEYSANNDYFTFFKLMCRGHIFVNLPEKLLLYRIHDKNDTFVHIKKKFYNTLKIRILMVQKFGYKPTGRDLIINISQLLILSVLPEDIIKNLYLISKGIIKPTGINVPIFGRLAIPSV